MLNQQSGNLSHISTSSLVAQAVKNLPAMQENWIQSHGWEGPLEKGMATHSTILAWRIPWTKEPGRLQSMGLQRVRHDWATNTFISFSSTSLGFPGGTGGKASTSYLPQTTSRASQVALVVKNPPAKLEKHFWLLGFSGGSDSKESAYNAGDPGSTPGLRRSLGEGNSNPLQYCCLENPMDRGAWQAAVHGVVKSRIQLSN